MGEVLTDTIMSLFPINFWIPPVSETPLLGENVRPLFAKL
jgi:hypothetical protein